MPIAVAATLPTTFGTEREPARPHRAHRPRRWYRRQTLPPFHRLIQRILVCNFYEVPAAFEGRQGRKSAPAFLRAKERPQCGLDQLGHGPSLARGLGL